MGRWLRAAIVVGLTPLLFGLSVFVLWLLTRWEWLMGAGLVTIYAGVLLVAASVACLIRHAVLAHQEGKTEGLMRRVAAVAALQLLNLPAAAGVVWGVAYVLTTYTVEVRNETSATIPRLAIAGGGFEYTFEAVKPDARERVSFHVHRDDSLTYRLKRNDTEADGVVDGYVTKNGGGHKAIVVRDGSDPLILDLAYPDRAPVSDVAKPTTSDPD